MAQLIPCAPKNAQKELKVTIPGVGELKAFKQKLDEAPSPGDLAATLIGQAQPALAPVVQVLRVVEVVISIIDLLKSIKNPFKIAKKLRKVLSAFANLAAFIPGVPYVRLVRDIIEVFASILHSLAALVNRWIGEISSISQALVANQTLDDPELFIAIDCAKGKLIEVQGGVSASLKDISAILTLISKILDIIKSFVPGGPVREVINVIKKIVAIPTTIANAGTKLSQAKTGTELDAVVKELKSIGSTMEDVARKLDDISATLTSIVGR